MGPDVHARPLTAHARRSRSREYVEAILVAVVLALFVRTFLLQAYAVPTASMEDNILVGDHLVVNKFVYGPRGFPFLDPILPRRPLRNGDVFVFKFPEDPRRDFVKRVIALPGDVVEIHDKVVSINGASPPEPEVTHADASIFAAGRRDQFGPLRVPAGQVFALGDNRDRSNDSRFWGTVPLSHVKGRALLIYWSASPEPERESFGRRVVDFVRRTRWERTFRLVH
jgi:signal peptidase I